MIGNHFKLTWISKPSCFICTQILNMMSNKKWHKSWGFFKKMELFKMFLQTFVSLNRRSPYRKYLLTRTHQKQQKKAEMFQTIKYPRFQGSCVLTVRVCVVPPWLPGCSVPNYQRKVSSYLVPFLPTCGNLKDRKYYGLLKRIRKATESRELLQENGTHITPKYTFSFPSTTNSGAFSSTLFFLAILKAS